MFAAASTWMLRSVAEALRDAPEDLPKDATCQGGALGPRHAAWLAREIDRSCMVGRLGMAAAELNGATSEFAIAVDRDSMPVGPSRCTSSSRARTELRTTFTVDDGSGQPVAVDATLSW